MHDSFGNLMSPSPPSGLAVVRVFVDPILSTERILRAVVRQIGFALVAEPGLADVCIAPSPRPGSLSWCPGAGFGVSGAVGTFDADLVHALGRYQRGAGQIDYAGRSFTVCADQGRKSEVLHCCIRTLFQLLLSNGQDVRFLWWYPDAARGAVNYRVDVDDNVGDTFQQLAKLLERHMGWCSLYFTTSSFRDDLESICRSRTAGAEIGSHCHYHYTFERDPATNKKNLNASADFLRQNGIDFSGAVMPSGKSFPGIGGVMADAGLSYTSNFGLIFDALPIELSDRAEPHLEVPIHPVAPGNVIKASASLADLDDYLLLYYLDMAARLNEAFLPLFFYGHNNDTVRLALLPGLLDRLVGAFPDHAFVRLDHYAAFWQERLDRLMTWRLADDGHNVAVISHQRPDRVSVQGRETVRTWPVSVDSLFRSSLSFVGAGARKPRWRDRLADRYELETVLPISALSLASLQGWGSVGYKVTRGLMSSLLRWRRPNRA